MIRNYEITIYLLGLTLICSLLSTPARAGEGKIDIATITPDGWVQQGQNIDGEAELDESGYSVSLSSDGNIVAIGAPGNDGNGSDIGHARVYKLQ